MKLMYKKYRVMGMNNLKHMLKFWKNGNNMPKSEIKVECNEGTKYKIFYNNVDEDYVLYYRNDVKSLPSIDGGKAKGEWLYLYSEPNYCDVLAYLCEEIQGKDAKEGF